MSALNRVIVLNLALAFAHQTDAAYWREWEMFGLPGGIQLFNAVNVALFAAMLACFAQVVARRRSGFHFSLIIAALCASILPIHAGFALAGFGQFDLPVSIFLIVATFVVSIVQVVLTLRARLLFVHA